MPARRRRRGAAADGRAALRDAPPGERLGRAGPARLGRRRWRPRCATRCEQAGVSRRRGRRRWAWPARSTAWSPLDAHRRPLRPAIIWLDRRADARRPTRSPTRPATSELHRLTGLDPDASHSAPKVMWLRDHEPGHVSPRRAGWPPVGGYLLGWLTGELVQDHANASSTLLYDVDGARLVRGARSRRRAWTPRMLARDRARARWPATLRRRGRRALGLTPGLPGGRRHRRRARRRARRRGGRARAGRRRDRHRRAGRGPGAEVGPRRRAPGGDPRPRGRRARCWSRTPASSPAAARCGSPRVRARQPTRPSCSRWPRRPRPARDGVAVPARAVRLDGAALERPDARRVRRPGDEPRRPRTWPGPCSRAARSRCATSSTGSTRSGLAGDGDPGRRRRRAQPRCGCRSRPT